MRMVICLQIPIMFWINWRIFYISYSIYMALMMLGRQKCIQLSH